MKLHVLAQKLGCRLEGNGELEITGAAGIDRAGADHVSGEPAIFSDVEDYPRFGGSG
jgi:hypothetical protein